MKNIKLIFSVLVLAMGAISFVNAQNCLHDPITDEYICNPWQHCPSGQCICDVAWPWFINSWNYCGNLCQLDSTTGEYQCNNWEYCPLNASKCFCFFNQLSPWAICGSSATILSCSYSGKTIFSGNSMQLYKTMTWSCEQTGIVCGPDWNTILNNLTDSWYIYTWCTPLGWSTNWSTTTWSNNTGSNNTWSNNWWGWWGWGGWWGSTYTPACNFVDLMCVNWIYQKKPGVSCIWWNLWNVCSTTSIPNVSGNVATDNNLNPADYTKIWDISKSIYSAELNKAYLYAYNIWSTTMPNIFKANLTWTLIRSHMAKMIVEWSKKVLRLEADTGVVCDFDDINYLKWQDLYAFIIEACQMWLMWVDNKWKPMLSFDPSGKVSRAQFGTVLSRAIRWEYYNGWDPFYNYHLQALNSIEIMTKISKPFDLELRGRVMLMLHRAHTKLSGSL